MCGTTSSRLCHDLPLGQCHAHNRDTSALPGDVRPQHATSWSSVLGLGDRFCHWRADRRLYLRPVDVDAPEAYWRTPCTRISSLVESYWPCPYHLWYRGVCRPTSGCWEYLEYYSGHWRSYRCWRKSDCYYY